MPRQGSDAPACFSSAERSATRQVLATVFLRRDRLSQVVAARGSGPDASRQLPASKSAVAVLVFFLPS